MRIKMLRKNDTGEVEEFFVHSWEGKQLLDTQRKKYRQLEYGISAEVNRKQALRQRQKLARELRVIKKELAGMRNEIVW